MQNIVNLPDEPMQGEAEIGHTITYTLPISNHGNVMDYFRLETTSTWPVVVVEETGPVAPGETIQVVIEVTVPLDVHVGDQGTTMATVYSLRDPNIMDGIPITTTVVGNEVGMTQIAWSSALSLEKPSSICWRYQTLVK